MIVLALGRFGSPHSRVLTQVRRSGTATREELVRRTGLSASTVARSQAWLLGTGLLVESRIPTADRTPGRPSIPVAVDTGHFVTLGCHVGRRVMTLGVGDLRGRVLRRTTVSTPADTEAVAPTAEQVLRGMLTALLREDPDRTVIGAGLVGPWGDVAHDPDAIASSLERSLDLPVATGEMIPALASAEYLARDEDLPGSTLYVYSRDTVGFVMANQRPAGMEIARVGRLGHFPAGGLGYCRCGRTGCLETVVSNEALLHAARAAGVTTDPDVRGVLRAAGLGHEGAHRLLCARAEALGRVTAIVSDMVHPDRIVLCGQGFTDYPPGLDVVRRSFAAHAASDPDLDLSFTRISTDVQAVAAASVALRPLYDDPVAALEALELDRCRTS